LINALFLDEEMYKQSGLQLTSSIGGEQSISEAGNEGWKNCKEKVYDSFSTPFVWLSMMDCLSYGALALQPSSD